MKKQLKDCWVDVFELEMFGGRMRRLRLGEVEQASRVGSMIVGPGARAQCMGRVTGAELFVPASKLVTDFPKWAKRKKLDCIQVAKAA